MNRHPLALAKGLLIMPASLGLISLDRHLLTSGNPLLKFPRTAAELSSAPERIFHLLRDHHRLPQDAELISCEYRGGATTEPDKNVAIIQLSYSTSASTHEKMDLFVKIPTARQWRIIVKSAMASFTENTKEIRFYQEVLPTLAQQAGGQENLGFAVPKHLYATWSRAFDRSIIIQECVDMGKFHSRPDWMSADVDIVQRIVDSVASLHKRTWQLRSVPATLVAGYTQESGVDWLEPGMSALTLFAPSSFREMWKAIKARTAREPKTISHGDCRLGNCLLSADYSEVILTDWEVNSITFYLWDITYCMICSLTPDDRRKNEEAIIRRYLETIGADPANHDVPSLESAMEVHRLGLIIVNFFGGLILAFGAVGKTHGNSNKDVQSWAEKCEAATMDALQDEAALARSLGVEIALVRDFRRDYRRYLRRAPTGA